MEDEDRPAKPVTHEIGMVLDALSVGELEVRIALLKQEIARIEAAISAKRDSKSIADSFFKS